MNSKDYHPHALPSSSDLSNMFNNISRVEFLDIIPASFPELIPLIQLFYDSPGAVYYKLNIVKWATLFTEEGSTQGCPLSPILASLVVVRLLEPINNALCQRAAERLANGITHDDGRGGITTNLLGFIDDFSTVVPLKDLLFLCQQFRDCGLSLGCFINPDKTKRILTSTNGKSPIPTISSTNPGLASDITEAIATFSTKPNKLNPSQPTPVELTDGFQLLGIPVGSPSFVIDFINEQLVVTTQQQSDTIHSTIFDPQTRLRLFQSCTVQKIPHLLLTDALHNLNTNTLDTNTPFTRYNGPLTSAINEIISNFLSTLLNLESLPEYSRRISQLDLKNGGLGMYDPQSQALADLAINIQTTSCNAIRGIITHPHLPPTKFDITISELFSIDTNPASIFLQRFHNILPNLASIACPPTIPQDQLCQYFLTTLSPKQARGRFKEATAHYQPNDLYETFSNDMPDHIHLLPSILSPTTSYPIAGMSRSQIPHQLPPIPFALNMRRKLQIPILPYEYKCQCNKTYDIYGDHPFNCSKNHKGRPHNMITNKFSQALAPLRLSTANIISLTSKLTEKHNYTFLPTLLHVPSTYPINQTVTATH